MGRIETCEGRFEALEGISRAYRTWLLGVEGGTYKTFHFSAFQDIGPFARAGKVKKLIDRKKLKTKKQKKKKKHAIHKIQNKEFYHEHTKRAALIIKPFLMPNRIVNSPCLNIL